MEITWIGIVGCLSVVALYALSKLNSPKSKRERIRILFLAADPRELEEELGLGKEARRVQDAIREMRRDEDFEFVPVWQTQPRDLQRYLALHKPHFVHFSCHGSRHGDLQLQDESGQSAPVSLLALRALFAPFKDVVGCVLLNACHSEQQAEELARELDWVIAMTRKINDDAACEFAVAFYRGLAEGKGVERSFALGVSQLRLSHPTEYSVPRLIPKRVEPARSRLDVGERN